MVGIFRGSVRSLRVERYEDGRPSGYCKVFIDTPEILTVELELNSYDFKVACDCMMRHVPVQFYGSFQQVGKYSWKTVDMNSFRKYVP